MAGAGARAGRRGIPKRKPNFTLQEIDILMSEVLRYEQLLFGASSTNVNAYEKQKIWWRITNKINAAGRNQRDIGEVKNRWRGLRRRANDKITRHRQERQAPPDARGYSVPRGAEPREPELGPQWGLHGVCPLDAPPGSGEVPAQQGAGVKEEPVKEEPVDVKPEPFHTPSTEVIHQQVTRGGERRLLRSAGHVPDDPCEGWSQSPQNPSQNELAISELGGQQEPLGTDFTSIIFDQEAEHLNDCNASESMTPVTVALQEGGLESGHLSPVEKRILQSNEQLVQEMRAFRREYTESRRETASILRIIAKALSSVSSSLCIVSSCHL
ncbi:myb-related transcription factor, partner of profilin-like isoform X3 [Trachemys scripta elegans]|uniref:myb-related transcription factor, partner of profilin-like isoform X3 n=1 Tax=Trachemys scripta elegans TaxID=31138 RepID=UPI00155287E6|nr:myb-related transcription factor, partner of profilin-like isoform X3 [Trachemys scripta elegans]